MENIPKVKIGDKIKIGAGKPLPLSAVVYSTHYRKTFSYDIEVAYDQDGGNLVIVEVIWDGNNWQFVEHPVMGRRLNDSESYKYKNILKNETI